METFNKSDSVKIGIGCMTCGSFRELTREEAEYNRYFGTCASIYICDRCKNAIEWVKERMDKEKEI